MNNCDSQPFVNLACHFQAVSCNYKMSMAICCYFSHRSHINIGQLIDMVTVTFWGPS